MRTSRRSSRAASGRLADFVDRNIPILFNVPTGLFLFGLVFVPILLILATSFTDWQLITERDFKL